MGQEKLQNLPGCSGITLHGPSGCWEKPEAWEIPCCQCSGGQPWRGPRAATDDKLVLAFESPSGVAALPAEASDREEQRAATLLGPVRMPEPSSLNVSEAAVIASHRVDM